MRHLLTAIIFSALPLVAQGVYSNVDKPGDSICPKVEVAIDPNIGRQELSGARGSNMLWHQEGQWAYAIGQRKDVSAFAAYGQDGKPIRISDEKGKIVIVGFWSVHCDPSARMLMEMSGLYSKREQFGFETIAVNMDSAGLSADSSDSRQVGGWPAIRDFKQKNKLFFTSSTMPIYLPGLGKEGPSSFMDVFHSLPVLCIVDKSGKLAFMDIGYSPNLIARRLSQLIREEREVETSGK